MKLKKSKNQSLKNVILQLSIICILLVSSNVSAQVIYSAAIGAFVEKQFSTGKLFIRKIVLEKPHIIPASSTKKFFAQYEGKEIGSDDIKEIQKRLSKYYYANGYVNSGVIIPNQKLQNGELRLRAIHGRLTRVKTKGNKRVSNAYVKNAIAKGVTVPLNSHKLQEALENLQKHPLIAEVKAQISPGEKLGKSILELIIKEEKPYFLSSQISNHQSPSIGQYRLGISGGHRDIAGHRDTLKVDLGLSQGLKDANVNYTYPLTVDDYFLNAYVSYGKFQIIDDAFSEADINSTSTSTGVSFSAPVFKTSEIDLSAGIGMDFKHMTLEMFGQRADLSEDFENGESNSTPMVFHLNALYQRPRFVTAVYAGIRRGLNLSAFSGNAEKRVFTVGVGQLAVAFKPKPKLELHVRINGQFTRDDLLPAEKFAIGGSKSVRGFRENLLVRDNGVVVSTQLRYSLLRSKLYLVPFLDYGRSWDFEQGTFGGSGDQIHSVGLGAQWKANKQIYTELFWGKTLSDASTSTELTQDLSFHFLLRYTVY